MGWDKTEDAKLLASALETLRQMSATEGYALTEDSYTARIPGKTLRAWHDSLKTVASRLRAEIDL